MAEKSRHTQHTSMYPTKKNRNITLHCFNIISSMLLVALEQNRPTVDAHTFFSRRAMLANYEASPTEMKRYSQP